MQIKRSYLLIFTAALGVFMILYSLIRHFFKISFTPTLEKYIFDSLFFVALALLLLNRRLVHTEKKKREALAAQDKQTDQILKEET